MRKVSNIPLGEGKLCEEDDMAHMVSPLALVSGGLNLSFKKKNCLRHHPYPFFFLHRTQIKMVILLHVEQMVFESKYFPSI